MDAFLVSLTTVIFKETGIVGAAFFITTIYTAWLYRNERLDRKEAWKSYNKLIQESNKTIMDTILVTQSLKDHLRYVARNCKCISAEERAPLPSDEGAGGQPKNPPKIN